MKISNENEIGSNKTGVSLVLAGLPSTAVLTAAGAPWALFALPVVVTLTGVLICAWSLWRRS